MKPTFDFKSDLFQNQDRFENPFFKRFELRHAPKPLQLTEKISKNYFFPTFYADVTCAIGIFMCSYEKAQALLPHPKMRPVRMTKGRSLVAFSCYEYKNVMNVPPYNEIAMTIPVLVNPSLDVPVLPMVAGGLFKGFGYYVFSMPVTSKENEIRGQKIWGLPKITHEIDITKKDGFSTTVARDENGETYLELRVPTTGKATSFDVSANLYSKLGSQFLQSETNFKSVFQVNKYMGLLFKKGAKPDQTYLKIGGGPYGKMLRDLELEEHPFQFRYTEGMTSSFDLPNANYKFPE